MKHTRCNTRNNMKIQASFNDINSVSIFHNTLWTMHTPSKLALSFVHTKIVQYGQKRMDFRYMIYGLDKIPQDLFFCSTNFHKILERCKKLHFQLILAIFKYIYFDIKSYVDAITITFKEKKVCQTLLMGKIC